MVNISEKVKEERSGWLGHIMRKETESGVRRAYKMPVNGKGAEEDRN